MPISTLWKPPALNPTNGKALTIPVLNPIDTYGRNFHLAWLGFFVAFLSWFAFPPLIHEISGDLGMTPKDIANSNITALCSTLLARFILGPLCDRYGPRKVMAANLLIGAIPTAFVPLVTNKSGIFAIRFFIGFLGGTFVPCQVWCTMFFDKKIVGLANALAGGWGNAGGGVAFFSMPAVMNSFIHRGYSKDHAWKYSFVTFPLVVIIAVAAMCLLLGQDCPEGKWSERTTTAELLQGDNVSVDDAEASFDKEKQEQHRVQEQHHIQPHQSRLQSVMSNGLENIRSAPPIQAMRTAQSHLQHIGAHENVHVVDATEIIEAPTLWGTVKTAFHYSTLMTALPYATTFGGELAVESIISSLYMAHAKKQGQTWTTQLAGNWGSMLGLLNVVTRPLGGYISDVLYKRFKTPHVKKIWMLTCGFLQGVFMLYIGLYKGISMPGLIVSIGFMCLWMEMGNGANFALVPHINPHHTGIVSGSTGSFGNIGGILLSLSFRFTVNAAGKAEYQTALWYIGVAVMGINLLVAAIPFGPTLER